MESQFRLQGKRMKIGKLVLSLLMLVSTTSIADVQQLAAKLAEYDKPAKEAEFGYKTAANIAGASPILGDAVVNNYLTLVGKTLVKNSGGDAYRWTFAAIDSPDINAFAAPGGYVFVTKGLLKALNSEDELAAVLAHEISHVRLKHYVKVAKKQVLAEYAMKSLAEGQTDGQLEAMSKAATLILAKGLDKQSEYEADYEAMRILALSGYDPSALVDVLNMLESKSSDKSMAFLLSTHPSATERIQSIGSCCAEAYQQYAVRNSTTKSRFDKSIKSRL